MQDVGFPSVFSFCFLFLSLFFSLSSSLFPSCLLLLDSSSLFPISDDLRRWFLTQEVALFKSVSPLLCCWFFSAFVLSPNYSFFFSSCSFLFLSLYRFRFEQESKEDIETFIRENKLPFSPVKILFTFSFSFSFLIPPSFPSFLFPFSTRSQRKKKTP